MEKTKQLYCPTCGTERRFTARRPSGLLHTFLTLVTCGLWLAVWPLFYARSGTMYSCPMCGGRPGKP
jgi:hypothetical protein